MSRDSKRDWTIIVTRPGHTSSHYVLGPVRRALFYVLALGTPLATGIGGYVVGTDRAAPVSAMAAMAATGSGQSGSSHQAPQLRSTQASEASSLASTVGQRNSLAAGRSRQGGAHPEAADGAQSGEDGAGEAGQGDVAEQGEAAEDDFAATGAPAVENGQGFELGPALSLQLDMGGSRLMRLHPFTADGRIIREAFTQLAGAMACEDGRQVSPSARLVRVLMAVHERFEKPLLLVGGRCGAHDDEHGSETQHAVGRAVDLRMLGVSTGRLVDWLKETQPVATAIGRYKKQGFVHVDVRSGERTTWDSGARAKTVSAASKRVAPRRSAPAAEPIRPANPAKPERPLATSERAATQPVATAPSGSAGAGKTAADKPARAEPQKPASSSGKLAAPGKAAPATPPTKEAPKAEPSSAVAQPPRTAPPVRKPAATTPVVSTPTATGAPVSKPVQTR